ncbi:MAG TPA: DNA-3-methyladenine glycosylase I, partial [Candidatus Dormibacteraeota bacterium]|nr:DNA-3-methyladenine glycosylase I [Candidatus Dormibacteraeota bacterium]
AKIESSIENARAFLTLAKEHGSFANWLWSFVDGVPIVNRPKRSADIPASSELSERISRELRKRGFRFVGATIIYAYLQSVGVVDDHLASCFRAERSLRSRSRGAV